MIRLTIDGQDVPIDQKSDISITAGIADIEDPESTSSGYSKSVEVPFTPQSMRVFGFVNELYSKEQFNNALHTAEYFNDDVVVMSGVAQIEKVSYTPGAEGQTAGGAFHVSIVGASFDWISRAKKPINELQGDEVVIYTMDEVYDNSVREDETLVKFFPVDRGAFWKEEGEVVARTELDIRDYHPFVNVWKLIGLIFRGYKVISSIQDILRRLYCSGYMPVNEDLSYIKEENDFLCGTSRKGDVLKLIRFPAEIALFDKWKPDKDCPDVFVATDGILETRPGGTLFQPTASATASFKIKMSFRAPFTGDGNTVNFINGFSFGPSFNSTFHFGLADSDEGKEKYWATDPGDWGVGYLLLYIKLKNAADVDGLYLSHWRPGSDEDPGSMQVTEFLGGIKDGGQYMLISHPGGSDVELYLAKYGRFSASIDDSRYVEKMEAVRINHNDVSIGFNMEVTTPAYMIPKEGFQLCTRFEPAEDRALGDGKIYHLKVGACEISPKFENVIGEGDEVGISTIGGTNTQLDFLAAIRQMFNLTFYTNPLSKEVTIEPRTAFYNLDRACLVDWRSKIDYAKPIEVQELGSDVGNALKLAYTDGNEVVEWYNWKNKTELGAYKTELLNKTTDEPKEVINPIFAPFLLRTVESMGMTIPQDVSEKNQDQIDDVELDVTPIVGYFAGVAERTAGSDKDIRSQYPKLVFQDATQAVNLGFDDIQSTPVEKGLNQYYKDNISAYNHGRRITVYMNLQPRDVEALQIPNSQVYDFRAVFVLHINGEDVPCTLEQIEDYKPGDGSSTKCQFISDPNIRLTGKELVAITYDGQAITYRNKAIVYKQEG